MYGHPTQSMREQHWRAAQDRRRNRLVYRVAVLTVLGIAALTVWGYAMAVASG